MSVSQTCDKGKTVLFTNKGVEIRDISIGKIVATGSWTKENLYTLSTPISEQCLLLNEEQNWLWHKRLGHINFDNLEKFSRIDAIRGLPKIEKLSDTSCAACNKGKQTRTWYKEKEHDSKKSLELIYMGLMGPTHTLGYNGEKYILVIVDDYSRMTFLYLLKSKDQAFDHFISFKRQVERMIDRSIKCIRTDRGGEFVNQKMIDFYDNYGIWR